MGAVSQVIALESFSHTQNVPIPNEGVWYGWKGLILNLSNVKMYINISGVHNWTQVTTAIDILEC